MSYIYKIINDINNKIYIGKTNLSIQKRFKEHCRDSKKIQEQIRPLYRAMAKYGIEHFQIEEIEECLTEIASEREQYWINYYESYINGYNATLGGDGKQRFNHEEIATLLRNNPFPKQVAEIIGCSVDTVSIVAKEYHIKVQSKGHLNVNQKKAVSQYDKNGNLIQIFESIADAARWLYEQGKVPSLNGGVRTNISRVCQNKRKSAYKYVWKYEDE